MFLAVAGCGGSGGGGEGEIPTKSLARAVLQPADLPPAFSQFDGGKIVGSDLHPGPRESLTRFDRLGGWKARYRRAGSSSTPGPLVVQSLVDLFPDGGKAGKDLAAYEEEFTETTSRSGGSAEVLHGFDLGDGAVVLSRRQPGPPATRYYTIAWRYRNATASLAVDGFDGKLSLSQAMALARKQQARIAALAGG